MKENVPPSAAAYRQIIDAGDDDVTGATPTSKPKSRRPEAGQRIGRYELIRSLGAGGMGEVFLARDTRLGRRVAVKFVNVVDGASGRRFIEEARTTASCQHENIVVIHEADSLEDWHYIVLEYLQGQALSAVLKETPALPPGRAVELVLPVVRALVKAHAEGIVHRDLKPDNVFLTETGTVKVLDFGIATVLRNGAAIADEGLVGTASYMAPEQWRGEGVDHSCDLWAVGMILFRALAGRHPVGGADAMRRAVLLDQPMPTLASLAVGVPPGLCAVVDTCLSKRKEDRYRSAEDLLAALTPFEPGAFQRELKAGESPFTGLASFQEADAARFFGRAREVSAFVTKLRHQPLLLVAGSSGAGKSSFVRAGVVPALKRSGEAWEAVVLRPSRRPLEALADALLPLTDAMPREGLLAQLKTAPGFAGHVLRTSTRRRGLRTLVFIDQFEELYTLCADPTERAQFTAALLGIADDATTPSRVVAAMRADFLDRLGEDQRFVEEATQGLTFLNAPGREGLEAALVQPAELAGYRFEHRVIVDEMLAHLQATPGALPLLQFTALKLWDQRDETRHVLTEASYRALGGIGGALAAHADAIISELPAAHVPVARQIVTALVTSERTRRAVPMNELLELAPGQGAAVERLVDQFVRSRLLVAGTTDGAPFVELVHESLIASWPRLSRWLDEGREDVAFREQLRAAAKQWDARARTKGLLWRGDAHDEAHRWNRRRTAELPERDQAFLEAVLREGTRTARLRRLAVGGLIALFASIGVGSTLGLVQVRQAEQRALSEAQRAVAENARAQREAQNAREAEARATEQFTQLKAEQEAKAQAEAALEQGKGDLRVANSNLERALKTARTESENARQAAERANELARSLQKANDNLSRLLAAERLRAEQLERERKKIATELK